MEREELIKKFCEIVIHVGLSEDTEPTIEGIVKELRRTNCDGCKSFAGELESLSPTAEESRNILQRGYGAAMVSNSFESFEKHSHLVNLFIVKRDGPETLFRENPTGDGSMFVNLQGYYILPIETSVNEFADIVSKGVDNVIVDEPAIEKPITAEEVLDRNGFDFAAFEFENEHSAKNLLSAMEEYASLKPTVEPMTAEEGNYIIVREQNSTRVYRNGEKLHPNDVPIVMCQLSDKERELLDKIQQQYMREIESTEKPMTAEQVLEKYFPLAIADEDDWAITVCKAMEEYASKPTVVEREVSDEEIKEYLDKQTESGFVHYSVSYHIWRKGAKAAIQWMRELIKERNK